MPVYEYECGHCGVMEISQSIKDNPLSKCPKCNRKVKKLISMNSFHLKGSGWYATDYAKKTDSAPAPKNDKTECPKKNKDAGCAGCEAKTESNPTETKSATAD